MAKNTENTPSNYMATIAESSRELSARERVMFKDTQNAISINELAEEAHKDGAKAFIEGIAGYVVLDIHNDKSDDKDYKNYLVIDKDGQKYVTGSQAFWNSFKSIYDEMAGETEPWSIEINLLPSKNYKGKNVLTCSLI
jgi:hypothetical protein